MGRYRISSIDMGVGRDRSRAAATSKMEYFVMIVNEFPSWMLEQS